MVKVREDHPILEDGTVNLDLWLERIQEDVNIQNTDQVIQACEWARQAQDKVEAHEDMWADNHPGSYRTGLEMAEILAELSLDQEVLVAAILYRSVREDKLSLDFIRTEFGVGVAKLIEGVLQMAAIGTILHPTPNTVLGQTEGQLDNVRKMLVTMIDDVRVALIKLAERTCAIRAVKNGNRKKRYRVAREVFDIYAPLAHRLGIGHIKWELEDLSFRYLQPNAYKQIASLLDEKRLDRQTFIDDVLYTLRNALDRVGIEGELMGRAKHIYSIWRKMQRKNIDFHQVYDVRAVRMLVPEVRDCYAALGIVHGLWKNIPHEFDDYIASPKENGYASLHTAVIGPEGKVLEIQIRTHQMHEEAELGVCAHWLYKGTDTAGKSDSYEDKINWLRQVLEWHEDVGNANELLDQIRTGIEEDRIYAFTPDGHVVDLAAGATPLDFAYRVHTEVGHRCRGVKINGKIVPLNTRLATGDQVEVLTAKEGGPSRDWLNHNLGYVNSTRARAKIRHWFKEQARDQNLAGGRQMAEREMKRLALSNVDYRNLATKLNYQHEDDMFASLGAGDLRISQVIGAAQRQLESEHHDEQLDLALAPVRERSKASSRGGDVMIGGVGNLLSNIASCCKPVPGDAIVGFITQGRGVSIHRSDCSNALQLEETDHERMIEVSWEEEATDTYTVDILIEAYDRSGLLRDIMNVMANENVSVAAVNTRSDKKQNIARIVLTMEIRKLEELGRIMDKIGQLPNITDVHRQLAGGVA
ncbi:GTP diphosphokinase [Motiliproteus sp. MSK22-1]|uniref:GTP diphosphokinase n=1 Tax=Motiliproteus sp. MSK22-1 TaxID=1897630 RepID=UPI00097697E3|nr:GTP diphosphokinase [Motiliproteus sp. MSK22-1]OMH38129.1 GTP diphosphokinase [Motiliproteus sp. MSK22-1]